MDTTLKCRWCGRTLHEVGGYLARVSPVGERGVWECRPSCESRLSADQAVIAAIHGEAEAKG